MRRPNAYLSIAWFPSSAIFQLWIEPRWTKLMLLECNTGILHLTSNFETDSSKFYQIVIYSLQWTSLEPREVKMKILKSVQNGINDADVYYCVDEQTFSAEIKVSIDANGFVESSCGRCLYRTLLIRIVKCQFTFSFKKLPFFKIPVYVFHFAN